MAASVISFDDSDLLRHKKPDTDEDLDFVLPSEVDCLGRPISRASLSASLRRHFSMDALRASLDRLRRHPF